MRIIDRCVPAVCYGAEDAFRRRETKIVSAGDLVRRRRVVEAVPKLRGVEVASLAVICLAELVSEYFKLSGELRD